MIFRAVTGSDRSWKVTAVTVDLSKGLDAAHVSTSQHSCIIILLCQHACMHSSLYCVAIYRSWGDFIYPCMQYLNQECTCSHELCRLASVHRRVHTIHVGLQYVFINPCNTEVFMYIYASSACYMYTRSAHASQMTTWYGHRPCHDRPKPLSEAPKRRHSNLKYNACMPLCAHTYHRICITIYLCILSMLSIFYTPKTTTLIYVVNVWLIYSLKL